MAKNLASSRGFQGRTILASLDFKEDRPLLPWYRSCENFNTKLAITRPI